MLTPRRGHSPSGRLRGFGGIFQAGVALRPMTATGRFNPLVMQERGCIRKEKSGSSLGCQNRPDLVEESRRGERLR